MKNQLTQKIITQIVRRNSSQILQLKKITVLLTNKCRTLLQQESQ